MEFWTKIVNWRHDFKCVTSSIVITRVKFSRGNSTLPLYVWGSSQFSLLSLKPINFLLYIWKISQHPKSITLLVKSNKITMITNVIKENNNTILNFFSFLWCTINDFFKRHIGFNWDSKLELFSYFSNIKGEIS